MRFVPHHIDFVESTNLFNEHVIEIEWISDDLNFEEIKWNLKSAVTSNSITTQTEIDGKNDPT